MQSETEAKQTSRTGREFALNILGVVTRASASPVFRPWTGTRACSRLVGSATGHWACWPEWPFCPLTM